MVEQFNIGDTVGFVWQPQPNEFIKTRGMIWKRKEYHENGKITYLYIFKNQRYFSEIAHSKSNVKSYKMVLTEKQNKLWRK